MEIYFLVRVDFWFYFIWIVKKIVCIGYVYRKSILGFKVFFLLVIFLSVGLVGKVE